MAMVIKRSIAVTAEWVWPLSFLSVGNFKT
jgi:hypothetical protein